MLGPACFVFIRIDVYKSRHRACFEGGVQSRLRFAARRATQLSHNFFRWSQLWEHGSRKMEQRVVWIWSEWQASLCSVQSWGVSGLIVVLVQVGTGNVAVHYTGVFPDIQMPAVTVCAVLRQACVPEHIVDDTFYQNSLFWHSFLNSSIEMHVSGLTGVLSRSSIPQHLKVTSEILIRQVRS